MKSEGVFEGGGTDCHSQCAHWLRNDRGFTRTTVGSLIVRRGGALPLPRATARVAPTERNKKCHGRADVGSELSAAGGRSSEVSEWPRSKFPASAVRQRRNFGHRNRIIVPYGYITRGAGKESPSHGFAVPAPFRQGGRGDGLPRALRALAMTHYKMRYKPGGRTGFAMTGEFYMGTVGG